MRFVASFLSPRSSLSLRKRLNLFGHMGGVREHSSSESGQTTIHVLNKDIKDMLLIDSYSQVGFRLNIGIKVLGSIVLFPQTVFAWTVTTERDISEASMALFQVIDPKLDILVLGYGDRGNKVDPSLIQYLTRNKIYVESLPTDQACTTYNFLVAEGRNVAAALIPPTLFRTTDNDLIDSRIKQRRLYKVDSDMLDVEDKK